MRLVNTSQRPISIGGVLLSPHVPADVDDAYRDNQRVKELLEEKVLEHAAAGDPAPSASQAEARPPAAHHGSGRRKEDPAAHE